VTLVAALYVDPRGPYPALLGPEMCWDEARDARTYAGPWPVVAHPPCRNWSALRHLAKGNDSDCGLIAFEQVRKYGGVLEQPAHSRLFHAVGASKPTEGDDPYGGHTIEVCQVDWGHVARKRTWVYCVGCRDIPPILCYGNIPPPRKPTHWCSGVHTPGARGETPPGIKICSAQQRRRTPPEFAKWLVSLAAQVKR
jgi:hypothetical protein